MGRTDDLTQLHDLLNQNQQVNITATVGIGGVGKTELALQYAQSHRDDFTGGICWLRGVTSIELQIINFARDYLALAVPEEIENPVDWCCQRWPGEGPVLMVVDDVQDDGALKQVLPSGQRFQILLTTRQTILDAGQRLTIEVLKPEAALELLRSFVDENRIDAELEAAQALCESVGRLPLGIELVGWHLARRPSLTIAQLLAQLEQKKLIAKALVTTNPEMTATLGVAAALELSWELLSDNAKLLAGLFGVFAAAIVRWEWVQACLREMEQEDLEAAQVELRSVHLMQTDGLGCIVHPLVQHFFSIKLENLPQASTVRQGFTQALTTVAKTIPQTVTVEQQEWLQWAVPHLEKVANQGTNVTGIDKSWCDTGLARYYESLSLWAEAEQCYERALAIREAQLGAQHPDTALSLNNLADLYESIGRYEAAEPLYKRALAIHEAQLGAQHPDTAVSLNNLADLYESIGRYEAAEPLYERALAIREAQLGAQHLDTADTLNNLAGLYESIGRYEAAEPLYERALAIREAQLGTQHSETALSLNNLAFLYSSMGRHETAEPLYERALKIYEANLGPNHLDIALSLNNLALLYDSTGRYKAAEPLYERALAIYETNLGPNHPDTALSLNNLAKLHHTMGDYEAAEPLYARALEIYEANLGPNHPDTALSLNNLAGLHHMMGNYEAAEPLYERALAIREAHFGTDHPHTVQVRKNIGIFYEGWRKSLQQQGRAAEAIEILEKLNTLRSQWSNI